MQYGCSKNVGGQSNANPCDWTSLKVLCKSVHQFKCNWTVCVTSQKLKKNKCSRTFWIEIFYDWRIIHEPNCKPSFLVSVMSFHMQRNEQIIKTINKLFKKLLKSWNSIHWHFESKWSMILCLAAGPPRILSITVVEHAFDYTLAHRFMIIPNVSLLNSNLLTPDGDISNDDICGARGVPVDDWWPLEAMVDTSEELTLSYFSDVQRWILYQLCIFQSPSRYSRISVRDRQMFYLRDTPTGLKRYPWMTGGCLENICLWPIGLAPISQIS